MGTGGLVGGRQDVGSTQYLFALKLVVIGVDTHRDTLAAAVVHAGHGGVLAQAADSATGAGYARLLQWADRHAVGGRAWAIEGTGSYGAGLTAHLAAAAERVIEVDRPKRIHRGGKTDAKDAVRAARHVLGADAVAVPRQRGHREALRVLHTTRHTAVVDRTAAVDELKALIVCAPEPLRERLRGLAVPLLLDRISRVKLPAGQHVE